MRGSNPAPGPSSFARIIATKNVGNKLTRKSFVVRTNSIPERRRRTIRLSEIGSGSFGDFCASLKGVRVGESVLTVNTQINSNGFISRTIVPWLLIIPVKVARLYSSRTIRRGFLLSNLRLKIKLIKQVTPN